MKKSSSHEPHNSLSLKILFADDEVHLQELIAAELPRMGHTVTVCPDGLTAVAALDKTTYDCVLVDLDMPGMNGIEVIRKAKEVSPTTEAIVLTGKGSTDTAIEALRLGAFEYLQKPCKLVELKSLLARVAARRELNNHIEALKRYLHRVEGEPQMIGAHRNMQLVNALIEKVAPTPSTVLIRGETGTGKELAARAVHNRSLRADKPFVAINCGALPENLIESELFGHRKGAFTGADEHRQGLFEVANGGTLFLDEIGELPKATQSKLLRVLESGEIRRVGDNDSFQVDVRIVCATHRDLSQMVDRGEFRQDLMYRINTFEIKLPPLRDRLEDIPELATHLLSRNRPDAKHAKIKFEAEAMKQLQSYTWPGNIRELANVVEHASILCDQLPIKLQDLPQLIKHSSIQKVPATGPGLSLKEIEIQAIHAALEFHKGNKTAAAQQLGVSLKTLYNKLNQDALAQGSLIQALMDNRYSIVQVLRRYSLEPPVQIKTLGNFGGFSGARFWQIETATRTYLLRRWPREHPTKTELQQMHRVLLQAHLQGLNAVACPVECENGATFVEQDGHLWELAEQKPGVADFCGNPSRERLKDALQLLARFHQCAAQFSLAFGKSKIVRSRIDFLKRVPRELESISHSKG